MTKNRDYDSLTFEERVIAVLEDYDGANLMQRRRDADDLINAAVTKAVQQELAKAIKGIFGPAAQIGKDGTMQMMNDRSVAEALMNGVVTSTLLRSVYGLVPNLLGR